MIDAKGSGKAKEANALNWAARGICEVKKKNHYVYTLQCVMKAVIATFPLTKH
jgi:hypothetical protein